MDAADDAEGEDEATDVCPKVEPMLRTESISSLPELVRSGESSQSSHHSSTSEDGDHPPTDARVNNCWPLRASGEERWKEARCLLKDLPVHHAVHFIGRGAGLVSTDFLKQNFDNVSSVILERAETLTTVLDTPGNCLASTGIQLEADGLQNYSMTIYLPSSLFTMVRQEEHESGIDLHESEKLHYIRVYTPVNLLNIYNYVVADQYGVSTLYELRNVLKPVVTIYVVIDLRDNCSNNLVFIN